MVIGDREDTNLRAPHSEVDISAGGVFDFLGEEVRISIFLLSSLALVQTNPVCFQKLRGCRRAHREHGDTLRLDDR